MISDRDYCILKNRKNGLSGKDNITVFLCLSLHLLIFLNHSKDKSMYEFLNHEWSVASGMMASKSAFSRYSMMEFSRLQTRINFVWPCKMELGTERSWDLGFCRWHQ